jgi:hypothetical protein
MYSSMKNELQMMVPSCTNSGPSRSRLQAGLQVGGKVAGKLFEVRPRRSNAWKSHRLLGQRDQRLQEKCVRLGCVQLKHRDCAPKF